MRSSDIPYVFSNVGTNLISKALPEKSKSKIANAQTVVGDLYFDYSPHRRVQFMGHEKGRAAMLLRGDYGPGLGDRWVETRL